MTQGSADDDTGRLYYEFKGASSDVVAITLAGTGHYDGSAGAIKGTATNTTATSAILLHKQDGTSGFVILEFRKDETIQHKDRTMGTH